VSLAEVEAKIRAAVAEAKLRGFKIRKNMYYAAKTSALAAACCPPRGVRAR